MTENPFTIMVVDDTPANLGLLERMLRERGYQVRAFPRGDLALSAASRNPPDLVLLDIRMPGMDGFEVCARLKADEALREIPVIFLSALSEVQDKVKAFAVGGVDYVTKPFQVEEVHARVETHLNLCRRSRQLREAYDKLRELEALRDNLIHMIAHDMRSPLMTIWGGLELIGDGLDDLPGEDRDVLEMARSAAEDLTGMIDDMLDISRMESGELPIHPAKICIGEVARGAVASLGVQARIKDITLHSPGQTGYVRADADILRRVLVNLLMNAIKFSPEGTHVRVTVREEVGRVRVGVTDEGRAVPEAYREKIFHKFGQLNSRKEGQKHSTGLGLAFCKLMIEAHGGHIGVTGGADGGNEFWITLPPVNSDAPES